MRVAIDMTGNMPPNDSDGSGPRSVAVVGAGITGLVAAWELRRRGVNVVLYEASGHAGGAIRTTHADGFLAEHGPNSFVTSPAVESLLQQLHLEEDVVQANPGAKRRYVVRDGRLVPFPLTPSSMLGTSLLSLRAKLRVLLEPLVRTRRQEGDESVASFVRRRRATCAASSGPSTGNRTGARGRPLAGRHAPCSASPGHPRRCRR